MELKDLEQTIEEIKERNKRVELDKKWETSGTRKLCIAVLTYVVVVIYSYSINKISNVLEKCDNKKILNPKINSTSKFIEELENVVKLY